MKTKIFLLWAVMMFAFTVTSCKEESSSHDSSYDFRLCWISMDTFYYPDTSIYDISLYLLFHYPVGLDRRLEYSVSMRRDGTNTKGIFEINDNLQSFAEWQECNIKFPSDTTKNWLFRFEGKNIPTNISVLYDNTNIEYTLVFWDSVSNIKYNFTKSNNN